MVLRLGSAARMRVLFCSSWGRLASKCSNTVQSHSCHQKQTTILSFKDAMICFFNCSRSCHYHEHDLATCYCACRPFTIFPAILVRGAAPIITANAWGFFSVSTPVTGLLFIGFGQKTCLLKGYCGEVLSSKQFYIFIYTL